MKNITRSFLIATLGLILSLSIATIWNPIAIAQNPTLSPSPSPSVSPSPTRLVALREHQLGAGLADGDRLIVDRGKSTKVLSG